jgi:flagellar hook-basal body complex protein FliE
MNKLSINQLASETISNPMGGSPKSNAGFADALKKAATEVNQMQHQADHAIDQVVRGKLGVHEGMLAINNADLSLRMLVQVRNKVMDAYREIMRMQF